MIKLLLTFLLLSAPLFAKPEMWRIFTKDSNPSLLEYYGGGVLEINNAATKVAIHPDIIDAILVYEPVEIGLNNYINDWVWYVDDAGSLKDLLVVSNNRAFSKTYNDLLITYGINPDWKVEDKPVSYKYPYKKEKKYKVIPVKKEIWNWTWGQERAGKEEFVRFLNILSSDKNVKNIQILAKDRFVYEVFYQERTYEYLTKTVEVE